MANPYTHPGTDYPPYRPPSSTNVQDLNVPYYNRRQSNIPSTTPTPAPPPHSQPPETYNAYPRTDDKSAYIDYSTPYTSNPYPQDPSQPISYQRQSYQDSLGKPAYPDTYAETGGNPPTPPPPKRRTLFSRIFNGDQKFAFFCWTISIIQIGVFVGELIKNAIVQHTPIQIQPTFNPLIGPSSYAPPSPSTVTNSRY